jgi:hypothetical protein
MRDFPGVDVFLDRDVGRRAERAEQREHFILFDQPARLLDRLGRRVAVVQADQIDLAPVDPARGIDLVEVCRLGAPDGAEHRQRAAVGHGLAELDFLVARSRTILLLRMRRGDKQHRRQQGHSRGPVRGSLSAPPG